MKILKVVFIAVIVLIASVLTIGFILLKTFDVNRFKPQIISQASKVLNRQVNFEKASLTLSLRQGISLKISNLAIADDPVLGKGDFLAVKNISLAVNALKYIFKKEVNIPDVLIDSPRMTLIRQKDGSFNVQSIAPAARSAEESVKVPAPLFIPAVLISSIKGSNGQVLFIDRTFEPSLSLEISDLSFSLSEISLTRSFPFTAEGSVLSSNKNIKLEGKAQVDIKTGEVTIFDLNAATELSEISLEKIPEVFPPAKGLVLPESLNGKVDILLKTLTAGSKGLSTLIVDAALTNGGLNFKEMALPVKDVTAHMEITEKKLVLDRASFAVGEGIINASGLIDDYLMKQEYSLEADVQNLRIQDLLAQEKFPVKAEGVVAGKINLKGQGFNPEALKSSLSGAADLSVRQAKLKDINVLRVVLEKISVIPGLAQKVEEGLPERFKQKLAQPDTVLSDFNLPVALENGRVVVKNLILGADEFIFQGSADVGLDSAYTLEGSFLIPQELSASMVAQVPELQYLLNNEKQVYFPLKISGEAGGVQFSVDAEYIAKRLLMNQAEQQLMKVINKAIGAKEESPNPSGTDLPQADAEKKPQVLEERIGSIIDSIFKK